MAIYQKQIKVIHDFPAYKVIQIDNSPSYLGDTHGISLKDGDKLYDLDEKSKHMISSVISSSIKDGKNPIEAYERALKNGHDTHFIFGLGSCLTSHDVPQDTLIGVRVGQIVNFEGKTFEIVKQPNRNLGLKEL